MKLMHITKSILVAGLMLVVGHIAQAQQKTPAPTQAPTQPTVLPGTGVTYAFVADGAGGEHRLTENLNQVIMYRKLPVVVRGVHWARNNNLAEDFRDQQSHQSGANRMAAEIQQVMKVHPGANIFVVGHCAGCRVALLATEQLPAGSIDRIILLYPAVSQAYDTKSASKAARNGMDVFVNPENNFLETFETEIGNADGHRAGSSGRFGFGRLGAAGTSNIRLHRSNVGHSGVIHPTFLTRSVLPLLAPWSYPRN